VSKKGAFALAGAFGASFRHGQAVQALEEEEEKSIYLWRSGLQSSTRLRDWTFEEVGNTAVWYPVAQFDYRPGAVPWPW